MLKIACTGGTECLVSFSCGFEVHSQPIFFVSIQVLLCPVDLIREARAQIRQKQLYFNVTGIRFAEERILKWA